MLFISLTPVHCRFKMLNCCYLSIHGMEYGIHFAITFQCVMAYVANISIYLTFRWAQCISLLLVGFYLNKVLQCQQHTTNLGYYYFSFSTLVYFIIQFEYRKNIYSVLYCKFQSKCILCKINTLKRRLNQFN